MGSVETDMTMTPTEQFAAWLARAMRAAGLNIDSLRGGGRSALADKVGVAPSTVNRWLNGQAMPDPTKFEAIANAVGVPVIEMLVEIGVLSAKSVTSTPETEVDFRPTTPSRAADELGIRDPVDRELFFAMLERLNRGPRKLSDASKGDEAAEG